MKTVQEASQVVNKSRSHYYCIRVYTARPRSPRAKTASFCLLSKKIPIISNVQVPPQVLFVCRSLNHHSRIASFGHSYNLSASPPKRRQVLYTETANTSR